MTAAGWRQMVRTAFRAVAAVALAWFVGLVWFAATVPGEVEDPATRTDAIVVLTGGSERTATGIALLEAGRADKLFISGVHKGVDVGGILRHVRLARPDVAGDIVLGHSADDTIGNATETSAWVAGEHIRSLRLVTASYHMRRSLWEFRRAMPDVAIIPHPVFPDSVKSREWWLWPGTAGLLATEYSKYLAAIVRHALPFRQAARP